MDGRPVKVVVADDQSLILTALSGILEAQPDLDVVDQVSSGPAAVAAVESHDADVAVLDVVMAGGNGLEAAAEIREISPRTRILLLTSYGEEDVVREAMDIGAQGFLVKGCSAEDLVDAVRRIAAGGAVLSPDVTGYVLDGYRRGTSSVSIPGAVPPEGLDAPLTARERDVLGAVARARTNAEIADELVVAESTVKTYISRLISKLKARDRVGLAVWAHESGYLDDAPRYGR
ncbi:response regulator transcription factor [Corynebacterium sp.]|uniref:response regulator transcription factor n=1 Tax=Corynebacterium sp. TaxID=1720 RepID=UPI0028AF7E81|nr:response regulator transcription factor [Corynebacterium sp.]